MYFSRIRIRPEIHKSTQLAKVLTDSSYNIHRLLWDLFPEQKQGNFLYREEIGRKQMGVIPGVRSEPIYYVISMTEPSSENPFFIAETKDYNPKLQPGDRMRFELRANPVVTGKIDREDPEKYLKERSGRLVKDKNKLTKKRIRHDVIMDTKKNFLESLCKSLKLHLQLPIDALKRDYKKTLLAHGGESLDDRLTSLLKADCRYAERLSKSMTLADKLEWSLKAVVDEALDKWMIRQGVKNGFLIVRDKYGQLKLQSSAYQWHALTKKAAKGEKAGFSSVDFAGDLEVTNVEAFTKALFEGIGRSKAFGCGLMLVKRI